MLLTACRASIPIPTAAHMSALPYPQPSRFLSLGPHRIAYEIHGAAHPQTLLLIHPWAGNMRTWDALTPILARHFRVVLLDLPGHGHSNRPPGAHYTVTLGAQAVEALIAALDLTHVTLIGNSLGGGIALKVAHDLADSTSPDPPRRLDRLILIDALGGGPTPALFRHLIGRYLTGPLLLGVDNGLIETFSNQLVFERHTRFTDAFVALLLAALRSQDGPAFGRAIVAYLKSAVGYDATPWLDTLRLKTHIIWGKHDLVIRPHAGAHLHRHIPGSTLTILNNCGHMAEVECPTQLLKLLGQRLAPMSLGPARTSP